jgi:PhnB protein
MTIKTATPYLILNGRAQQAIGLYREALGAEVHGLQRFGDVDQSCPAARRDLVMHAELRFGETVVMLSDGPGEGAVPTTGAVQIALALDDAAQLRSVFSALSAGGTVIQPPMDAPWGDVFGALGDRFGVGWMLTAPQSKAK